MKKIGVQWIVENVVKSVGFYSKQLGFEVDYIGDEPQFAIVKSWKFFCNAQATKGEKICKTK